MIFHPRIVQGSAVDCHDFNEQANSLTKYVPLQNEEMKSLHNCRIYFINYLLFTDSSAIDIDEHSCSHAEN